jgi:trehalose 6-phosphate phosphatase
MADALPPFARAALLLDLDGTLLDLAPTPDSVVVPPDLPLTLARLRGELDGALAVITGRPVETIDALLPGIIPAVAGEHGGAFRTAPGAAVTRPDLPTPPGEWLIEAEAIAAANPGVLIERKARGFVLHYRLAPTLGPTIETLLEAIVRPHNSRFQLVAAHMAWEVRPRGADKGLAVEAIMALPGFAYRLPVFIGDDVTDEDGMVAARRLGGAGLFVPTIFGTPAGVRSWLSRSHQDWAPFHP